MTDKEKMLAGELYQAFGPELSAERLAARKIVHRINTLPPEDVEARGELFRSLFGKAGERFHIEPPFRCDYGCNIFWGEGSYANFNLTVLDCAEVRIGAQVLIGPNVSIFTAGHPLDPETRAADWEFAKPVTIGNRVWIGGGVIINPGVTIGENSVVGSGSVVTKDIPANVIAAGNPCRVLRAV